MVGFNPRGIVPFQLFTASVLHCFMYALYRYQFSEVLSWDTSSYVVNHNKKIPVEISIQILFYLLKESFVTVCTRRASSVGSTYIQINETNRYIQTNFKPPPPILLHPSYISKWPPRRISIINSLYRINLGTWIYEAQASTQSARKIYALNQPANHAWEYK